MAIDIQKQIFNKLQDLTNKDKELFEGEDIIKICHDKFILVKNYEEFCIQILLAIANIYTIIYF